MPGDPCFWLRQFFFDKTVSVFPLTYIMLNWGQEQLFLLPWYLKCAGQSEIKLALTDAGKVETKLFYRYKC